MAGVALETRPFQPELKYQPLGLICGFKPQNPSGEVSQRLIRVFNVQVGSRLDQTVSDIPASILTHRASEHNHQCPLESFRVPNV